MYLVYKVFAFMPRNQINEITEDDFIINLTPENRLFAKLVYDKLPGDPKKVLLFDQA